MKMDNQLSIMMIDITMRMIRILLMIPIIKGTITLTITKIRPMKMKMCLMRVKNLEHKINLTVIIQKIMLKDNWMEVIRMIKFLKKSLQKQKINI